MQDFHELRKRIEVILKEFGIKMSDLARICEVSHPTIANIINGKTAGFDVSILQKITSNFPINGHWLLTGQGNVRIDGTEIQETTKEHILKEEAYEYMARKKDAEQSAPHPEVVKYGQLQDEHIELQRDHIQLLRENKKLEARIKALENDQHSTSKERRA